MESDEEMRVDDNEPIDWPAGGKGKGKGKATAHDEPYDLENLPWCVRWVIAPSSRFVTKAQGRKIPAGDAR